MHEVKAKRLPELDDDFASEASEFDTLAELREDIASKLREGDERAIEREFEEAVLQAATDEATVELPDQLVHARAHELIEQTLSALARQGINKETYLQITGKEEEELAHDAEPDAAAALRREAVLAAIVAAEQIEPSDEELVAGAGARPPSATAPIPPSWSSSCARPTAWTRCARTWPAVRRWSCSSPRPSRSRSSRPRRARSSGRPARTSRPPGSAPGAAGSGEEPGQSGSGSGSQLWTPGH